MVDKNKTLHYLHRPKAVRCFILDIIRESLEIGDRRKQPGVEKPGRISGDT